MSPPDALLGFATAVLDPDAPLPAGVALQPGASAQARFAIYRNNVIVGLIDALRARFPVTEQLVGEEFFGAMAREFARAHPPTDPVMMRYGDLLPAYIEQFTPAASLAYLADVSRVELLWSQSWAAAEAQALTRADLQGLSAEQLLECKASLHPAVRLLRSEHPAASLWSAHQGGAPVQAPAYWEAEDVLIARPDAQVTVRRLPPGGYDCVAALAAGEPLQQAFATTLSSHAAFDPGALLGLLIEAGALAALTPEAA
jgi:hypothetical protein